MPGATTEAPQLQERISPLGGGLIQGETRDDDGGIVGDAVVQRKVSETLSDLTDQQQKLRATLLAALALAGWSVHDLDGGGYLACRWGRERHCGDLHALAQFARQVGART
jgi:hypothetical protein